MILHPTPEEVSSAIEAKRFKMKIANRSCNMSTDTANWFFEKENYIVEVNEGIPWSLAADMMG